MKPVKVIKRTVFAASDETEFADLKKAKKYQAQLDICEALFVRRTDCLTGECVAIRIQTFWDNLVHVVELSGQKATDPDLFAFIQFTMDEMSETRRKLVVNTKPFEDPDVLELYGRFHALMDIEKYLLDNFGEDLLVKLGKAREAKMKAKKEEEAK